MLWFSRRVVERQQISGAVIRSCNPIPVFKIDLNADCLNFENRERSSKGTEILFSRITALRFLSILNKSQWLQKSHLWKLKSVNIFKNALAVINTEILTSYFHKNIHVYFLPSSRIGLVSVPHGKICGGKKKKSFVKNYQNFWNVAYFLTL